MAKKKSNDQNRLLITAIKKTVKVGTSLPILESVYFNGTQAIVSDLENSVIIPFEKPGLNICIPSKKVIQILEMMPDAEITALKDGFGANFTHGKRIVKITGDNPESFPIIRMNDGKSYKRIGSLDEGDMGLLETAICFVSKYDLRPAMTGVKLEKRIIATDAHRLFFHDLSEPVTSPFILPAKAAKILLAFGGEWEITEEKSMEGYVCFTNSDGVKLITRPIDSRFPNVDVVIPQNEALVKLVANPKTLLTELKNAGQFANKSTNQVVLGMNGVFSISSQEVDFGEEYTSEYPNSNTGDFSFGFSKDYPKEYLLNGNPAVIKEDHGSIVKVFCDDKYDTVEKSSLEEQPDQLYIAFNQKFLSEIISKLGDEPAEMQFWSSTKCTIVNKHFLLMPLMLG